LASTDWRHLGRLAGFTNQKLARRTPSGFAPWVKVIAARPILASAAQDLLRSALTLQSTALQRSLEAALMCSPCRESVVKINSPAHTQQVVFLPMIEAIMELSFDLLSEMPS
jgi:RepB DNA-primase from phage plasmid